MTAIAGYWEFDAAAGNAPAHCARMLDAQRIYAPDAPARRSSGGMTMGRRLHRLLPEDEADRGPIEDAAGRLLVADVRIDNRAELIAALGSDVRGMRAVADATLLALALERWDIAALDRIVGDFAVARWDGRRQQLLLARDFLGQRPLHYHRGAGFFAFASMPKGLHAVPAIGRAPDDRAMANFLALRPEQGGASFFEHVAKVPAGHYVLVDRDGVQVHRYWSPPVRPSRLARREDYADALREQLDTAVTARLRGAEGRLGAHLSGGLDSSAVTATAARLLQPVGGRMVAYTAVPRAGFAGADDARLGDEGPLAAAVAALYPNIEHVRISGGARSPLDGLDRNAFLYDRPVLNLCNGTWADAIRDDARRRGLRVMLVGSAGNASFSHDGMERLPQLLGRGRLWMLAREMWVLRRRLSARAILGHTIGPLLPDAILKLIARSHRHNHPLSDFSLISAAGARDVEEPSGKPTGRHRQSPGAAQLGVLRRIDYGNYNKGVLGGWGIDVRDPSADRRLVEFCLSVPSEQYLADGVPRALARRAFADRLPAALVNEQRKGYQAADWHEGLSAARAELATEIAHIGRDARARALIDLDRAAAMLHDWPTEGIWEREDVVRGYRHALLRAVSAGHFLRAVTGTN